MLSKDIIDGLNVAFNEATLIGVEIDTKRHLAGLTLAGVWLTPDGKVPPERRFQIILSAVGKFQASLRSSRWDDEKEPAVPFSIDELLSVVTSFQSLPVYGWDLFDGGEEKIANWKDRLSVNYEADIGKGLSHTLDLFQDGGNRILDMRVWFDEIGIFTPDGKQVSVEDFIAGGKRGWDALMLNNNKEIQGAFGIYPAAPEPPKEK